MHILKTDERIFLGGTRLSKSVPTSYGLRREVERKAFNAIFEDDELYARQIRAQNNLGGKFGGFEIFDELPDGWTTHLQDYGPCGLRGRWDTESKYVWCDTCVPKYIGQWPSIVRVNPEYRQALVRRPA